MKFFKQASFIILAINGVFTLHMQAQAQPQSRSILTESDVEKVLNSFQNIKSEFEDYKSSNAEDISNYIQANNAMEKVNKIVQKHGYQGFLQWQADLMRVAMVYAAHKQKLQQPQQTEIQAQIDKINNNPNISKEQKESLIKMMSAASSMVSNIVDADEKELAVIKKYENKLDALFEK